MMRRKLHEMEGLVLHREEQSQDLDKIRNIRKRKVAKQEELN